MKPDQLAPCLEVLPYAKLIGIQGHGEPLSNPHIGQILDRVSAVVDARASGYIITNGLFLAKHLDALLASRITTFNISLNATTDETHNVVMGLGPKALPGVIDSIKRLIDIRDAGRSDIQVTISMVLTADNIQEAASFVRLRNELGVTRIYLRTLMPLSDYNPGHLNYHLLSPFLHPEFGRHASEARDAVAASAVEIVAQPETWGEDCLDPASRAKMDARPYTFATRESVARDAGIRKYYEDSRSSKLGGRGRALAEVDDLTKNPYGRSAPFSCNFIYNQLITTKLSLEIFPCCYMTQVPGHEPLVLSSEQPFMAFWNSDAMMNLRRRLKHGPLYQACATCPMQR